MRWSPSYALWFQPPSRIEPGVSSATLNAPPLGAASGTGAAGARDSSLHAVAAKSAQTASSVARRRDPLTRRSLTEPSLDRPDELEQLEHARVGDVRVGAALDAVEKHLEVLREQGARRLGRRRH